MECLAVSGLYYPEITCWAAGERIGWDMEVSRAEKAAVFTHATTTTRFMFDSSHGRFITSILHHPWAHHFRAVRAGSLSAA